MTRHILVGYGIAGHHHLRILQIAGFEVLHILDKFQLEFDINLQVALEELDSDIIWHICTPTNTHVSYLNMILEANPNASIILEKPIGFFTLSEKCSNLFSDLSIVIQSQYCYSKVIDIFSKILTKRGLNGKTVININFSKNRPKNGRFVDSKRKALGYEGFHQLTILLRLLDSIKGKSFSSDFCTSMRILEAKNHYNGYQIHMRYLNFDVFLCSNLVAQEREAMVELTCENNISASLHFETTDWYTGIPRQTHLIRYGSGELVFEEDLMHTGILSCVDALNRNDKKMMLFNQERAFEIERIINKLVRM